MYTYISPTVKLIDTFCRNASLIRAFVGVLMLTGLYSAEQATAANYQPSLNTTETALAAELAIGSDNSARITSANDALGLASDLPTIQILLIEIKEQKQPVSAQRLAEVFLYNYATESTHYMLVSLTQSQVVQSVQMATHHLPLNTAERLFATQQVHGNSDLMQAINAELKHHKTGSLHSKVSIFEPMPTLGRPSEPCAIRRCAQLTFTTEQRFSLTIEPIVILATGEVIMPSAPPE